MLCIEIENSHTRILVHVYTHLHIQGNGEKVCEARPNNGRATGRKRWCLVLKTHYEMRRADGGLVAICASASPALVHECICVSAHTEFTDRKCNLLHDHQ